MHFCATTIFTEAFLSEYRLNADPGLSSLHIISSGHSLKQMSACDRNQGHDLIAWLIADARLVSGFRKLTSYCLTVNENAKSLERACHVVIRKILYEALSPRPRVVSI